jgi:hypothetical protein
MFFFLSFSIYILNLDERYFSVSPDSNTKKVFGVFFHLFPQTLTDYLAFLFCGVLEQFKGDRNKFTWVLLPIFVASLVDRTDPRSYMSPKITGFVLFDHMITISGLSIVPVKIYEVLSATIRELWRVFRNQQVPPIEMNLDEERGWSHFIMIAFWGFTMYTIFLNPLNNSRMDVNTGLPQGMVKWFETNTVSNYTLNDAYVLGSAASWCKLTPVSMEWWKRGVVRFIRDVSGLDWGGERFTRFCLLLEEVLNGNYANKDELLRLFYEIETSVNTVNGFITVKTQEKLSLFFLCCSWVFLILGFVEYDMSLVNTHELEIIIRENQVTKYPEIKQNESIENKTQMMIWACLNHPVGHKNNPLNKNQMKDIFKSFDNLKKRYREIGGKIVDGGIEDNIIEQEFYKIRVFYVKPLPRVFGDVVYVIPTRSEFLRSFTKFIEKNFPVDPLNDVKELREFSFGVDDTKELQDLRVKEKDFFEKCNETLNTLVDGVFQTTGVVTTMFLGLIAVIYMSQDSKPVRIASRLLGIMYRFIPFDPWIKMYDSVKLIKWMFRMKQKTYLNEELDSFLLQMNLLNITSLSFSRFMIDYIMTHNAWWLLGPNTFKIQQAWFFLCCIFHQLEYNKYQRINQQRNDRQRETVITQTESNNTYITDENYVLNQAQKEKEKKGGVSGLFSKKNIS